ncbi:MULTISPECIES: hypothetical protein [Pseudomonas]|uniref:Uncharacterized protein n=1 Tax=Pseudomonas aphyarum TaxID=2942629 RepID=A0ABT5PLQ3_9PSED|nr:hypothetical protein [Pseudomonas aphyarum]MDD0968586.1 hypothetical protein [Pseudomonas aphyarum]MDD1124486.1 hypothetical protein [Pseudomonas aphyarum]
MNNLVCCVRNEIVHADGTVFERFYDWQGCSTDFEVEMKQLRHINVSPVVDMVTFIVKEDGAEVRFLAAGIPYILPDRTGVLVVFQQEPNRFKCPKAPWFFGYPNNAAIYNADGSLRFQLCNPYGEGSYIGAMHSGAMPGHPNSVGVLVGTVGHDPEWLYLVDSDNPKLIPTGKWIRY